MKQFFPNRRPKQTAFTIVELLIVISIIVILAALLVPITGKISSTRMKTVARAELVQVATAIDSYKAKYGFYPPDNPTNKFYNSLFYELVGTISTNDSTKGGQGFVTLDGRQYIMTNYLLGSIGFANSSTSPRGTDEHPAPVTFLKEIKPAQITVYQKAVLLLCSQEWGKPGGNATNPWRYVSNNPTNNPGSYDLWIDLYIDGKTNRISNWSKQPIVF